MKIITVFGSLVNSLVSTDTQTYHLSVDSTVRSARKGWATLIQNGDEWNLLKFKGIDRVEVFNPESL